MAGFTPVTPVAEGADMIHARIIKNLETADLVLCDMTSLNPNVFFELGIRTALNKPACLVRDDLTRRIPFDLSVVNYHTYSSKLRPWDIDEQIRQLSDHIKKTVETHDNQNSLWRLFGLSTRASAPKGDGGEADKLEFLAMQFEALRKSVTQQHAQPVEDVDFANWVRQKRGEIGISQTQLAALVGVSQPYISQIERGLVESDWLKTEITRVIQEYK